MLKIISWWVRNSKAANLLMFSIIIIGILNFFRVEKEVFPIITAPVVSIKYGWPGASPKEIEDQILVRVEESLTDLEEMMPWEREIYVGLLQQHIKDENERMRREQQQNR